MMNNEPPLVRQRTYIVDKFSGKLLSRPFLTKRNCFAAERKERSGEEKNGAIELVNRGYWHGNIGVYVCASLRE